MFLDVGVLDVGGVAALVAGWFLPFLLGEEEDPSITTRLIGGLYSSFALKVVGVD